MEKHIINEVTLKISASADAQTAAMQAAVSTSADAQTAAMQAAVSTSAASLTASMQAKADSNASKMESYMFRYAVLGLLTMLSVPIWTKYLPL